MKRDTSALARHEQSILDAIPEAILSAAPDGTIAFANFAAERLFGYSRAEMLRQRVELLLPQWSERARAAGENWRIISGPAGASLEWRARRKNQTKFPANITVHTITVANRTQRIIFITDLTKWKQAEEALRTSGAQLDLARESMGMAVWDWNIESGQIQCTKQWSRLRGLPSRTLVLSRDQWLATIHPDDRERVAANLDQALAGIQPYDTEFRVIWPDGSVHWIIGKGKVFRTEGGQASRMLGVGLDNTGCRNAEEALRAKMQLRTPAQSAKRAYLTNLKHERTPGVLTTRERDVLRWVAEGKSAKEIALVLKISPKTVAFHKSNVIRRLGLHSTAELTRFAIRYGLVNN